MANFSKSPWVVHYDGSSCNGCDIEVLACLMPRFDVERFGIINTGNPKHADVFLVTGSVNEQNKDVVKQIYDQMVEPKIVVAVGICACSGGIFKECYNVSGGVDTVIPVDVYVPGCAARPEAIIEGVVKGLAVLDQKAKDLKKKGKPVDKDRSGVAPTAEGYKSTQTDKMLDEVFENNKDNSYDTIDTDKESVDKYGLPATESSGTQETTTTETINEVETAESVADTQTTEPVSQPTESFTDTKAVDNKSEEGSASETVTTADMADTTYTSTETEKIEETQTVEETEATTSTETVEPEMSEATETVEATTTTEPTASTETSEATASTTEPVETTTTYTSENTEEPTVTAEPTASTETSETIEEATTTESTTSTESTESTTSTETTATSDNTEQNTDNESSVSTTDDEEGIIVEEIKDDKDEGQ